MIKKNEKTWEIPLLQKKLGGVAVCIKKDGKTYYAPTYEFGTSVPKGFSATPLLFDKLKTTYQVYTLDKVPVSVPSHSNYKYLTKDRWYWNNSGGILHLKAYVAEYQEPENYDEGTNSRIFIYKLPENCVFKTSTERIDYYTSSGAVSFIDGSSISIGDSFSNEIESIDGFFVTKD